MKFSLVIGSCGFSSNRYWLYLVVRIRADIYSVCWICVQSLMSYVAGFLADSLVNRGVNRTTVLWPLWWFDLFPVEV